MNILQTYIHRTRTVQSYASECVIESERIEDAYRAYAPNHERERRFPGPAEVKNPNFARAVV
jgi:uncharacterized protein (UPF0305 family)